MFPRARNTLWIPGQKNHSRRAARKNRFMYYTPLIPVNLVVIRSIDYAITAAARQPNVFRNVEKYRSSDWADEVGCLPTQGISQNPRSSLHEGGDSRSGSPGRTSLKKMRNVLRIPVLCGIGTTESRTPLVTRNDSGVDNKDTQASAPPAPICGAYLWIDDENPLDYLRSAWPPAFIVWLARAIIGIHTKTCATFPKIRRTYPCVPTVIQDVAADDLEPSWPVAMQILTRGESNRSTYRRIESDVTHYHATLPPEMENAENSMLQPNRRHPDFENQHLRVSQLPGHRSSSHGPPRLTASWLSLIWYGVSARGHPPFERLNSGSSRHAPGITAHPQTPFTLRMTMASPCMKAGKHSILLPEQYADPRGLDHVVGPLQLVWYAEKMTLSNTQSAIAAVSIDQYHVSGPNIQSLSQAHRLSGNSVDVDHNGWALYDMWSCEVIPQQWCQGHDAIEIVIVTTRLDSKTR
ncbi:hypothetical protein BKA83DRAFT_24877 [Pisolithus microcarpus]|nr:hypothetical protein BKA83DRAFT_24877 [Pisolithus microcarpus]